MNFTVSYKLQSLGISGSRALITHAERGWVSVLECAMEECFCPGGRGYFELVTHTAAEEQKSWIPTEDHFPLEEGKDGRKVPENVRLAHRKCNRLGHGETKGNIKNRKEAAEERDLERARYPGTEKERAKAWAWDRRLSYPKGAPDFLSDLSPY